MNKSKKFSPDEVRERAVRLVQEHRSEYRSLWAAVQSIAPKVGYGPRTLLRWVKGGEMDAGVSQFTGNCHYFAVHGLPPRPPELLNKYLQVAISQLQRSFYGTSSEELTASEAALFERAGVDLKEHPDLNDPLLDFTIVFAAILATSLTPTTAGERLGGISSGRVRRMIHTHSLYAIQIDGRWHVPIFQFTKAGLVPNIDMVNKRLPSSLDAVSTLQWYTQKDPDLELDDGTMLSPLQWLKQGRDPAILATIAYGL